MGDGVDSQQHDIPGHGICKHMAVADIREAVKKAAHDGE